MGALIVLALYIFLLCYEHHWAFLHAKGVGDAIVFSEMGSLMQVIEDGLDGGWLIPSVPLSAIEEQTGRNLP